MANKEQAEELRQNIWKDYNNGLDSKELADRYGVSRSYVYSVISVRKGSSDPELKRLIDELEGTKRSLEKFIEENKKLKEENDLYKKLLIKLADK